MIGLVLAWLVVSSTLAGYLALNTRQAALSIAPGHPIALMEIAERGINAELLARATQEVRRANLQREAQAPGKSPGGAARAAAERAEPAGEQPSQQQRGPDDDGSATASGTARSGEPGRNLVEEPLVEPATLRQYSRNALMAEPLSARAVRLLGQAALIDGDQQRADKLLEIAARRSLHDSPAHYVMMQRSFLAGEFTASMGYADLLLRTRPDLITAVAPVLTRLAEHPKANSLLKQRLAANPPWRKPYMFAMLEHITDARTPLDVMLGLKAAGTPPDNRELLAYLEFLLRRNFHEIAYYAWLQFLPMERLAVTGHLYNGNFDWPVSGMPFDWSINQGTGSITEIAVPTDDGGNPALRVELVSGRVQLGDISQRLMLPPGKYVLKAKFRGNIAGRRGLRWRVICGVGSSTMLAETAMFIGSQRNWRDIEAPFAVPATGCQGQILRLVHDARYSAEQFVTGTMWYDNLVIVRQ